MEHSKQEELFGELFGFKVGDRVKTRRPSWLLRKGIPEKIWRWEYLTIIAIQEFAGVIKYRVGESDSAYSTYVLPASELVRVRKYVKKKA